MFKLDVMVVLQVVASVQRGYTGCERGTRVWTFSSALMYSLTIFTTIGLFNYTPSSSHIFKLIKLIRWSVQAMATSPPAPRSAKSSPCSTPWSESLSCFSTCQT